MPKRVQQLPVPVSALLPAEGTMSQRKQDPQHISAQVWPIHAAPYAVVVYVQHVSSHEGLSHACWVTSRSCQASLHAVLVLVLHGQKKEVITSFANIYAR